MTYATIDELRSHLGSGMSASSSAAYDRKMMHPIPTAPVVDREKTLLKHCMGKCVLEFGASGPLHDQIRKVASAYLGVDRTASEGVQAFDLDDITQETLPRMPISANEGMNGRMDLLLPEVILCGEVLEHLSNPGWFLTRLRRQFSGVLVVISVPNALSTVGRDSLAKGIENVNIDHVAWYSPRTVRTLLERAGYTDMEFAWYHGEPITAEGLIIVTR